MVPDTVEYGYLQTGERREGGYYGMWTFLSKVGQALALGLNGLVLQLSGFVQNVEQTELAKFGIRFLLGPTSGLFFAAAALLVAFYPLNEQRYNEVLAGIRDMESAKDKGGR